MLHTDILINLEVLAYQLNLHVGILDQRSQALLDGLDLLRDRTENTFLEPIELIETAPCADLTKTNEDTTHGLEVEGFVATEDEDESSKLDSQCLD